MASTTSSSHTHIYTLWIWYNRPWDWDCLKDWMCTFLVITSSSKRLKLILKFSEIMPLYPGGAFRCGDNGLIHSISFKPVVDQPTQPQMDERCMMLRFSPSPIFTQFAKALTCNIHFWCTFTHWKCLIQFIDILSGRSWTWYCVAYRVQNHIVAVWNKAVWNLQPESGVPSHGAAL